MGQLALKFKFNKLLHYVCLGKTVVGKCVFICLAVRLKIFFSQISCKFSRSGKYLKVGLYMVRCGRSVDGIGLSVSFCGVGAVGSSNFSIIISKTKKFSMKLRNFFTKKCQNH